MVRTTRLLLVWAALGGAGSGGYAQAPQTLPAPSPLPPEGGGVVHVGPLFPQEGGAAAGAPLLPGRREVTGGGGRAPGEVAPEVLRHLPEVPDLPASLYQPAPPPEPPPPLADR